MRCTTAAAGASDWEVLQRHQVYTAAAGQPVQLTSLWRPEKGTRCVVALLTHFADLSSTEFAQKLLPVLPQVGGVQRCISLQYCLVACYMALRWHRIESNR